MRPMRPAKRSSNLGLILIAGLVIGLLIAAYVFRGVISRTVPGADVIYALLHLSTDSPAADLEISNFVAKITHDERPATTSSTCRRRSSTRPSTR